MNIEWQLIALFGLSWSIFVIYYYKPDLKKLSIATAIFFFHFFIAEVIDVRKELWIYNPEKILFFIFGVPLSGALMYSCVVTSVYGVIRLVGNIYGKCRKRI